MIDDKIFENKKNLLFLKDNLKPQNINIIFTTRHGGISQGEYESMNLAYQVGDNLDNVYQNRQILAKELETSLNNFVFANQTHGIRIYKVEKGDLGKGVNSFEDGIKDTDALYTFESGINLACFYADCLPIYFYEEKSGVIGIIHSGWQGTVKLILQKVIERLREVENIDINNLKLIFGPSIKKDSFEVEEDVYTLFKEHIGFDFDKIIFKIRDKEAKYLIDTVEFNKQLALSEGIKEENIYITNLDTYQETDLFSFRRENKTGRMLAIINKK